MKRRPMASRFKSPTAGQEKTWRDYYRPIIAEIIETYRHTDAPTIEAALRRSPRVPDRKSSWMYKVWRSEIRRQLGYDQNAGKGPKKPGARARSIINKPEEQPTLYTAHDMTFEHSSGITTEGLCMCALCCAADPPPRRTPRK